MRPAELDYELTIRGVLGMATSRQKISALREQLKREGLGIETNPINSGFAFPVEDELHTCSILVSDIKNQIPSNGVAMNSLVLDETESRLVHLKSRLKRIFPESQEHSTRLQKLCTLCDELVQFVAIGRPSISRRVSLINPFRLQIPTLQTGCVQETRSDSNIDLEGEVASGLQRSTPPRLEGVIEQPFSSTSTELPPYSPRRTPEQFQQPVDLPISNTVFETNESHNSTVDGGEIGQGGSLNPFAETFRPSVQNSVTSAIEGSEGIRAQTQGQAQGASSVSYNLSQNASFITPNSRTIPIQGSARALGLQADVDIINRGTFTVAAVPTRAFENLRVSAGQSNLNQRFSRSVSRANQQSNVQAISNHNNNRDARETANTCRRPVINHQSRAPNGINPNFAHYTGRNANGSSEAVSRPNNPNRDANVILNAYNWPNVNQQSQASNVQNANCSQNYNRDANCTSGPFARPTVNQQPQSFIVQNASESQNSNRDANGMSGAFARPTVNQQARNVQDTIGSQSFDRDVNGRYVFPKPNYQQSQVPNSHNLPNQYHREDADPRDCVPAYRGPNNGAPIHPLDQNFQNQYQPRPIHLDQNNAARPTFRKSVPVNQWRISFNGEGRGMHLFDFLSQVKMYQRSEMISDDELLRAMTHLLSGRAAQWYESVHETIFTWNDLVEALKAEYLPYNYSFTLFNDICNRRQKPNESFGEYFTHLKSLFKWLGMELSESHKVHIVQKNLLPKYSSIAMLGIRNLQGLAEACRRIDDAAAASGRSSSNLPFENPLHYGGNTRSQYQRHNNVSEIDAEPVSEGMCEGEVCALRRGGPRTSGEQKKGGKCYNCNKEGHGFRLCSIPQEGVFCYSCGVRNVTTKNCSRCAHTGNENRDLSKQAVQPNPNLSQPPLESTVHSLSQ